MTTTSDATNSFDRYMRARYPIIAIVSHEETRVLRELKPTLKDRRRACFTWTATNGIVFQPATAGENAPKTFDANATKDPAAALKAIINYHQANQGSATVPPTVFIMQDLHPYATNAMIQRLLRDVVAAFEVGQHTLVLLSPVWNTPRDLEKSIVSIDWPLPTAEELSGILRRIENTIDSKIPRTLNGNRPQVIEALRGLTAFEAESVILNAVIVTQEIGDAMIPLIVREKKQIIKQAGALEFYDTTTTMAQVGGLQRLKEYARIKRATFQPKAREAGVEPARGVLLLGVPGVGKSLSAKAIAGGQMPLLRLDVGAAMGSHVGESEQNMRQALKTAEAISPCVLWLDEIEKALGSQGGEQDGGTSQRVFGTLLTWMQETTSPVYVVATANDVRALKPELLRRFDDVVFVDLPCKEDRMEVASIHLTRRNQNPANFDLEQIARATWGFAGAEIEKVVKSALEAAFVDDRPVNTDDLIQAAMTIVPISVTMKAQIDDIREWAKNRAITAAMPLEQLETVAGQRVAEI